VIAQALRRRVKVTRGQRVSDVPCGDMNEAFELRLADSQSLFLKARVVGSRLSQDRRNLVTARSAWNTRCARAAPPRAGNRTARQHLLFGARDFGLRSRGRAPSPC